MRTYGGVTGQQRTAERRARLIEAGFDVGAEVGVSRMTMTAVCASAGLTERYFYENFRNLDELLVAMAEAIISEYSQAFVTAMDTAPPNLYERCRAPAVVLFDLFAKDPRKGRVFFEATSHPILQPLREASMRVYAELLAEQMRQYGGLTAERYQQRLTFITTMLVGGLAEAVPRWVNGEITLEADELIDEGARLCVAAAENLKSGGTR